MGSCQCSQPQYQFPDLTKMAQTKAASSAQSYFYPPQLSRSQMLSQSMVYANIYKISNIEDSRISSRIVKSQLNNMPASFASRSRNILRNQQEIYIEQLQAIYYGQIDQGVPHGYGKLFFDNKDYLQCQFIQGRCNGNGRFVKADGSYYEGDLKNNVADGYGIYVGKDSYRYQGQWKSNEPNGHGDATYANGMRYVGQFFNNKKHGKGTLYQNGNIYRGEFNEDKIEGWLSFEKQNGQKYEGEWKQNKKHGKGKYKWPDGTQYEGEYENGKRHGKGRMVYKDNQIYDGEWSDGHKHGRGEFTSEKQHFFGTWKKGKLINICD